MNDTASLFEAQRHGLSPEYVEFLWHNQCGRCLWTGLEMSLSEDERHPYSPRLQMLDVRRGWVIGNVAWGMALIAYLRSYYGDEYITEYILTKIAPCGRLAL